MDINNPYKKMEILKELQAEIKACSDPIKSIELQRKLVDMTLEVLQDPEVKKLMALKNKNQPV
jgi:hypothetical protein